MRDIERRKVRSWGIKRGVRLGLLTVLTVTKDRDKWGRPMVKVQCTCPAKTVFVVPRVALYKKRSCGCNRGAKRMSMKPGDIWGRWRIESVSPRAKNGEIYNCKCCCRHGTLMAKSTIALRKAALVTARGAGGGCTRCRGDLYDFYGILLSASELAALARCPLTVIYGRVARSGGSATAAVAMGPPRWQKRGRRQERKAA